MLDDSGSMLMLFDTSLALDSALERLEGVDSGLARIAEPRAFGELEPGSDRGETRWPGR